MAWAYGGSQRYDTLHPRINRRAESEARLQQRLTQLDLDPE
jgi:hypothetical protein